MMLIVANGIHRSGSTLVYNWLRSIVSISGKGKGLGLLGHDKQMRQEMKNCLIGSERWNVAKIHQWMPNAKAQCGCIFTYRHPFDVAISTRRYHQTVQSKAANQSIQDLVSYIIKEYNFIDNSLENVFYFRYEDMHRKPKKELMAMLEALKLDATDETVEKALELCSVPAMQRVANRLSKDVMSFDKETELRAAHISASKGSPGAWKSAMSQSDIGYCKRKLRPILEKYGYIEDGELD